MIVNYELKKEIESEYFRWLCDLVGINNEANSYYILADLLHKREFYSIMANDDNRAEDGKYLRELFCDEVYWRYENEVFRNRQVKPNALVLDCLSGPCSMFEMLIALAKRVEDDILFEPDRDGKLKLIFWKMIENLGFLELSDDHFYDENGSEKCDKTLDILLNRKYSKDGKGGLFPLRRTKIDQREVEIWYQMASYLEENCYING